MGRGLTDQPDFIEFILAGQRIRPTCKARSAESVLDVSSLETRISADSGVKSSHYLVRWTQIHPEIAAIEHYNG